MAHKIILEHIRRAGQANDRELLTDPMNGYLANLDPDDYKKHFRPRLPEFMKGDDFIREYEATIDTATQVAIPEFDGRIITVPFSFKEIDEDGLTVYVADEERCRRVAGIAVRHAQLRHTPNADKRIGLVLSAYPTKHARIGNAVGLDTPASCIKLLAALKARGYRVGDLPQDGDALFHALIEAGGQDPDWLTEDKLRGNPVRIGAAAYRTGPYQLQHRLLG